MSNTVYPDFAGLTWPVVKRPIHKTGIKETPSGREFRTRYMTFPRHVIRLSYEWLTESEMQQLVGLFNAHGGAFESLLFDDRDDRSVTNQVFAVGDGATTSFQLARTLGGFVEPIYAVNGAPLVYRSDWQGQQLLYATPRTNQLLRSEEFDNASWAKTQVTVTADAIAAPDGTSTADTLVENTAATVGHFVAQTMSFTAGQNYEASVFGKETGSGSKRYLSLAWPNTAFGTTTGAAFDLATGTVTATANSPVTAIASLGNGWWRCSISKSATVTTTSQIQVRLSNASGTVAPTYTGDGASGMHVFGAQHGTSQGSYIRTTSAAVTVTDYALGSTGLVTLPAALAIGAQLLWTGNFYWRVRFLDDAKDFEEFLRKLWKGRVDLKTCKP